MSTGYLETQVCCIVVWCGVLWCGVVCCGMVCCVMVWCGVVWCAVVWSTPLMFTLSEQFPHMPNKEIKARGILQVSPF